MDASRLPKSVRRIVLLRQDSAGCLAPVSLYEKPNADRKADRKKGTRLFRPVETAVRRLTNAVGTYADTYAERHAASNRKRKDGWLRDMNTNVAKAARKSGKRLKVTRIFMP